MGLIRVAGIEEHGLPLVDADQQIQVPPVGHSLPLEERLAGLRAGLALPVSCLVFLVVARPVVAITIQVQVAGQGFNVDGWLIRPDNGGANNLVAGRLGQSPGLGLQLLLGLLSQGIVQFQNKLQACPGISSISRLATKSWRLRFKAQTSRAFQR